MRNLSRDLENLNWANMSVDQVKLANDLNALQMEAQKGQFETKTHKPIVLERLKLNVQNPASSTAYQLRCTLQ